MKKLIFLLSIIGLSFTGTSQIAQQDILVVDRVLVIPYSDTATYFPPTFSGRKKGAICMMQTDKKIYSYNGFFWDLVGGNPTPQMQWSTITATTKQAVMGEGYVAASTGGVPLYFTLPVNATVGESFSIAGQGAGGWRVYQNAGQFIRVGGNGTTSIGVNGFILCGTRNDAITIMCIAPNEFEAVSVVGLMSLF